MLYTISIAPKTYFHDVLAHHKDTPACTHPYGATVCLHQEKFNCHFDNLVVAALYVSDVKTVSFSAPQPVAAEPVTYIPSFHSCFKAAAGGRGPPVV